MTDLIKSKPAPTPKMARSIRAMAKDAKVSYGMMRKVIRKRAIEDGLIPPDEEKPNQYQTMKKRITDLEKDKMDLTKDLANLLVELEAYKHRLASVTDGRDAGWEPDDDYYEIVRNEQP